MRQIRATVRVRGRVQGVSFRYHTLHTAQVHNLTGWVRNLPSGDVEAVFEGGESQVRECIAWCRLGPEAARVDEVLIDWEDYRGEFATFEIRR